MDDEIRTAIEGIEFNPQKCEEIINKLIEMLDENNCTHIEADYIMIVIKRELDMYYMCCDE